MVVNRRRWMGLLAVLGLSASPARAATIKRASKKQVVHHVFFWLKGSAPKADVDKLIAGLQTLRNIPEVRELRIGVPAGTEERSIVDSSYSVSELIVFDTVEDQKRYQDHPIHQQFVKTHGHIWDKVVVYDSIDV